MHSLPTHLKYRPMSTQINMSNQVVEQDQQTEEARARCLVDYQVWWRSREATGTEADETGGQVDEAQQTATVSELLKKYCDLVWYARKHDWMRKNPSVAQGCAHVKRLYPEEVADLDGDDWETAKWAHGFNSGMLACLRLLHPENSPKKIHPARLANFPSLHT